MRVSRLVKVVRKLVAPGVALALTASAGVGADPSAAASSPAGEATADESAEAVGGTAGSDAATPDVFTPLDVFQLEWAGDPRISPDGRRVVYVRHSMDVMKDRRRSDLWMLHVDDPAGATGHYPLTVSGDVSSPRWAPDGKRLLYVAGSEGQSQLHLTWLENGRTAPITRLTESPNGVNWSPDGRHVAFTMRVPAEREPMAKMPDAPEGAEWAEPPKVIERVTYRFDGAGYLEEGFDHVFVVPADGGTPRQLTSGDYDHGSRPTWTPDGSTLVFSANRKEGWELDPVESELHAVDLETGAIRVLTDRDGPDGSPVVSPDGRRIAWLGYDDELRGHHVTRLHVAELGDDGELTNREVLTADLDRSVSSPSWSGDGRSLFVSYSDEGNGKVARVTLDGRVDVLASDLGASIGRPYGGGTFTVAGDGTFAYTRTRPERPADVAVGRRGRDVRVLTRLNEDLLAHRDLAEVEEIRFPSRHDGRIIHGWIAKPPGFDAKEQYPLLLEIHGGPFADYGDRFSAEVQLYAAAGYVVLYANPRGSTSYGNEFANLIHHAYPGNDFDDLVSGVDAVIARGYVDPRRLFVTGGSGGGVLTAWIVGKTDRFRAAAVQKPVINWYSFALTSDAYNFFYRYWFPGPPWEHAQEYLERSPISLVGNVETPTMIITGEQDFRTPMSESEQLYQALKLREIPTALVRIPGASHGIARRPSQLVAKVQHVLAWFERHDVGGGDQGETEGAAPAAATGAAQD